MKQTLARSETTQRALPYPSPTYSSRHTQKMPNACPSWLPNILHTCKVPDSRLHLPVALRGWTREKHGTGLDGVSWLFPCMSGQTLRNTWHWMYSCDPEAKNWTSLTYSKISKEATDRWLQMPIDTSMYTRVTRASRDITSPSHKIAQRDRQLHQAVPGTVPVLAVSRRTFVTCTYLYPVDPFCASKITKRIRRDSRRPDAYARCCKGSTRPTNSVDANDDAICKRLMNVLAVGLEELCLEMPQTCERIGMCGNVGSACQNIARFGWDTIQTSRKQDSTFW